MQQTSQFHLNQWELTDRIRMEDFNGDNQKLETALASLAAADAAEQQARTAQDAAIRREAAAAAEAVPLVKLLEVPVTQEAAQVDVDVSQIDFTQYYNFAGNGGEDRRRHECAGLSDFLSYLYMIANGNQWITRSTDVLAHRVEQLRVFFGHNHLDGLVFCQFFPIRRMYTTFER